MKLREAIWNYPLAVITFITKFSALFVALFGVLMGVAVLMSITFISNTKYTNRLFSGALNYGVVGTLETINPLEVGETDGEQMASKLIYNSLVSIDEAGVVFPELADTWAISPDGKESIFYLKKGVRWHDGYELTARDVATTFELLKSGDRETVLGAIAKDIEVEVRGTYEVAFRLKQVNAAFFELMATPILPEHLYSDMSYSRLVELGDAIMPVGTGPYQYIRREGNVLYFQANANYFRGKPAIRYITIKVFSEYKLAEAAFFRGDIQAFAPVDPSKIDQLTTVASTSERITMNKMIRSNSTRLLLFNRSKENIGKELQFRQAVAKSISKVDVAKLVIGADPAYGPYDSSSYVYDARVEGINAYSRSEANGMLDKMGWHYPYSGALYRTKGDNELTLALTFLDTETNRNVALVIREQLAKVGINLSLNGVSSEVMLQSVLPEKEFELLLFEINTGIDPDQYGLWHSSQTTFPGLNLGSYNSPLIDELLEKGRLQSNRDLRLEVYQQFQQELVRDAVAIFLYHPSYFEVSFDIIDRKLPNSAAEPSDRFSNIYTWKMLPEWRNWQTR
ncbi:hypothetical protein IT418_02615 [bacterium]|nr:hypothetical protein [bacterium]